MTDYLEEQKNEIEVLESIYPNEFQILDSTPYLKFKIFIKSDQYDEDDDDKQGAALDLVFGYTSTYPDEPPNIEISPIFNFEEDAIEILKNELLEQCQENLGMVMVFTLVSFTIEWLNKKIEDDIVRIEEEIINQKRLEEEMEQKRWEGTKVTVESFTTWKNGFLAKKEALKSVSKRSTISSDVPKRLTGRELFTIDDSLIESDLGFFTAESDVVAVDESLFQDLDDLDLEAELDDED